MKGIGGQLKAVDNIFSFIILMVFASVNTYAADLTGIKKSATLVSSSEERKVHYDLITGPIFYKEVKEDVAVSGYMPESLLPLYGGVKTKVYDFNEKTSSLFVFEKLVKNLQKQNYETMFYCMGSDCGEKDGWRVYLDRHLDGEEGSQHYIVSKKVGSDGVVSYKSAFVIDIDSQPRLSISNIRVPVAIRQADEIKQMLEKDGVVSFPALFFDIGSSELRPQSMVQLQQIARYFSNLNSGEDRLVLVGYADKAGGAEFNQLLSEQRAKNVMQQLITSHGINSEALSAKGLGASQSESFNLAKDRRVELIKETQLLGYKD